MTVTIRTGTNPKDMNSSLIIKCRKASFWTAIVGFCFFAQGCPEAALAIRLVTELLRFPYFFTAKIKDQAGLSLFVACGCIYGLLRYTTN